LEDPAGVVETLLVVVVVAAACGWCSICDARLRNMV
jgi:hypothetical protein